MTSTARGRLTFKPVTTRHLSPTGHPSSSAASPMPCQTAPILVFLLSKPAFVIAIEKSVWLPGSSHSARHQRHQAANRSSPL
jgi:hypothetical protein